jgi:hypothetical protein
MMDTVSGMGRNAFAKVMSNAERTVFYGKEFYGKDSANSVPKGAQDPGL